MINRVIADFIPSSRSDLFENKLEFGITMKYRFSQYWYMFRLRKFWADWHMERKWVWGWLKVENIKNLNRKMVF